MIWKILCTTFVSLAAWAKPVSVDPVKMSAIVRSAYDEQMDAAFLELANEAKKAKKASEFLIEKLRLGDEDASYLRKNLGDTPPPKIWKIKDGFEVSVNDRKFKVQRGAFGGVTLDGKVVESGEALNIREAAQASEPKRSALNDVLLPRAEAWMAPALRVLYYGARAGLAWWAASEAANVSTGVVLGCMVGAAEGPQDESWVKRCKDGAAYGKVVAWDDFGKLDSCATGVREVTSQADNAQIALGVVKGVTRGKISLLNRAVKIAGPLGVFAGMYQVGEDVLTMNGAQIVCGDDGKYALTSLRGGQADKLIYYLGKGNFMMGGEKITMTNEDAIKTFLIERLKIPADVAGPSAKAIFREHSDRVASCEKNPKKVCKVTTAETKQLNPGSRSSDSVQ